MKFASTLVVGLCVTFACGIAAAQYGPGGYGGGAGGYGGGGYGGGGYTPPSPSPYTQPGYRQPNYNPPTNPYGGNPYSGPQTNHYRGHPVPTGEVTYEYVTEEYLYCTSCNKKVSDSSKVGGKCPHCGVYWSHDDKGNTAPGGGFGFGRLGGLAVAAVVMLISFIIKAMRS